MPLSTEVGLDPHDIVLDGDPGLPQKGGAPLQFSAHGWIKMALGMEVCLGPGNIVPDGD